ncbi:MAG: glycosyltransferase [Lachnospiraceae bacterium]|nr:glycosyltransferase [Lachnospiraceae bacterium]
MRELRISQCMIVKNEEKNIERALSWGKKIMWEQIVVDTGSSDRTVELAKELGARVYHFDWVDDFSAAKNFALQQAKGDWIVFLDADEYILTENTEKLRQVLMDIERKKAPYLALCSNWLNLNDEGQVFNATAQIRIFRNGSGIHYVGRVHEQLEKGNRALGDSELLDAGEALSIYHTGYTEEAYADTGKLQRDERLLLKEISEQPDNFDLMGYLGDIYRAADDYEQAIEWYEKAVQSYLASGIGPVPYFDRLSWTFSYLLELLFQTEKGAERMVDTYGQAIHAIPKECDFDYIMGRFFLSRQDWENAVFHLEQALSILEKNGNMYYGAMLVPNLMSTWEYLAIACFNSKKKEKCVNVCVTYLKENRMAMGILKVLLTAFKSEAPGAKEAEQILGFLGNLYDLSVLKERLFVLKAAKEIAYEGLEQVLWGLFSPQEQAALKGRV